MSKKQTSQYPDDETRIREENRKLLEILTGVNAVLDEIMTTTGGDSSLIGDDLKAELDGLFRVMVEKRYGLTDAQVDELIARIEAEVAEHRGGSSA